MVVIGVALGVGAAVAVAGAVGFVGLVAPHLVRRAVGSDPARVMLPAALAGAALVLAADVAIRLGPSAVEIKLGVVTALIGVPIFLSMIFRERRLLEGAAVVSALCRQQRHGAARRRRRSCATRAFRSTLASWSRWSARTAPARPR